MKVESIEEFDGTVERGGYQANVSNVCNARDFGTFVRVLLYRLPLVVLVFLSSALLTQLILLQVLNISSDR